MPRPNGEEVAMRHLSATDAKQRLAALIDAAQCEPVVIRRQERDVAVLLWTAEYDRNRGLTMSRRFRNSSTGWAVKPWRGA